MSKTEERQVREYPSDHALDHFQVSAMQCGSCASYRCELRSEPRYNRYIGYKRGEKSTILITNRPETLEWFCAEMDRVEYIAAKRRII